MPVYIDPMTASEIAETLGIKVYTIAIGTTGRALSPIQKRQMGATYLVCKMSILMKPCLKYF